MSGLLVITAHPDDEVLIAGGTLAACAAAGISTGVVCLTRGENGPISDPALASRGSLAEVRLSELNTACAELGVSFVKCYRRQDGNLRWTDGGIVRQLTGLLDALAPDAVITFGDDGLYYHPDHVATHEITLRAVRRLPDPPPLYRSVWRSETMRELATELRRRGLADDLWGLEPEDFGTDDAAGIFSIDVRAFAERKRSALRAHRTQLSDGHALAAIDPELFERFFGVEWFAPLNRKHGWLERAVTRG